MEKNKIIRITTGLLILAVIVVLFFITRSGEAPTAAYTIQSDDGIAQLEIPIGALPQGVSAEDITITKGSVAELPLELKEGFETPQTLLVYKLLPEGIEFVEPVTVTISQNKEDSEGVIPVLFHASGDTFEIIPNTTVEIDLRGGTTRVSGQIAHFSQVGTDSERGMFKYESVSGGTGEIGDSFPFKLTIKPTGVMRWFDYGGEGPENYTGRGYYYKMAPGTKWLVKPFSLTIIEEVISPKEVKNKGADLKQSGTFSVEQIYTCVEEGNGGVSAFPAIDIEYQMEKQGSGSRSTYQADDVSILFSSEGYTCKKKKPEQEFILLGPPYTIICGDGTSLSGVYKADEKTGEILRDATGNGIDLDTGKPVVCPG